jgi:hypothetical protein
MLTTATTSTTVRLDEADRRRVAELSARYGNLSISAVLRLALLRLAEAEGIEPTRPAGGAA